MSPSAALHAVRQGKLSAMEIAAEVTGHHARCSLQPALSVAKTLNYPLNHAGTIQCTAATATERLDQADKRGSISSYVLFGQPTRMCF
jgi:hypothetical protein